MSRKTLTYQYTSEGSGYRISASLDLDDADAIKFFRGLIVGCMSATPLITSALQGEDFERMMRRIFDEPGYE